MAEHNAGMKVSNLYISQVKRKCGIEVGKNLRVATRRMDCLQGNSTTAATDLELVPSPNLPKNEDSRQPQCPEDKESAIVEALKHFKMIQQELKESDKSVFIKENIDETIFMFALFKCRKSDKGRN